MPQPSRSILWFRLNLRLHDNEALIQSLKSNPSVLFPVFTIDPHYAIKVRVGIRRWQFLLESLQDLDHSLRAIGSRLIVCRGNPMELFPHLFKEWKVSHLYMMAENQGGWSAERDKALCEMSESLGVKAVITQGHNLYSLADVVEKNKGKPPLTYTSFQSVISKLPAPEPPAPAPTSLPPVDQECLQGPIKDVMLDTALGDYVPHRDPMDISKREIMFKRMAGPNGNFDVPDITEFGFKALSAQDSSPHRGGETIALKNLKAYMSNKDKVIKFEKPKTSPAAYNPADTTILSPHLKFGTLSCRLFYSELMEVYKTVKKHSEPPVSLLGQLLWREFYYVVAYYTPKYSRMSENSVCLQIDWWCREGPIDTENQKATENLKAWSEARTAEKGGVDTSSCQTFGCMFSYQGRFEIPISCLIVFEELLLDHDPALNIGNWLWLSASAFFHQYFRVYSPIAFGKKYDKTGKAGVILGENYPHPIVDHDVVSKINMKRMKIAYEKAYKGGPNAKLPSTIQELQASAGKDAEKEIESEEEGTSPIKGKRKATAIASKTAAITKKSKTK
ncbi:hypothetical protein HDU67_008698 [Dinochytrium kinnereticum]|nr:hypothetical protein HDU67_008698 [Dinochytrium kinnereticum]